MGKMNYSNWEENGIPADGSTGSKSSYNKKKSSKKEKRQNLKDVEAMIKESGRLGREMFMPGKQSEIEEMMRQKEILDNQILAAIKGGII